MQTATEKVARERDLNSLSIFTAIVALAAVTMTFGALIAVFVIRSEAPMFWGHIRVPSLLWITTGILVASSATLESARRKLASNEQVAFFRLISLTTGLGVLFLAGQLAAWLQVLRAGVDLKHDPHSWFIFLFSGLHGLHILAGLGGLGYLVFRTREPVSGPKFQMITRVVTNGVAIFWHYLDLLWIVLFTLLLEWRP